MLQLVAGADDLGASLVSLTAAGVDAVELELVPEAWTDADAAALAARLHALAGHRDLPRLAPRTERSGQVGDVLVDRTGAIGRSDGLVPGEGLRPAWRLGHLDDLTGIDRHVLDLAEGNALRGAPRLAELLRRTARAQQVVDRFFAWLDRRGTPAEERAAAG